MTLPSRRAIVTMYGRLWSAVSLVSGAHFSGSFPKMVYPASWVSTLTAATLSKTLPSILFHSTRAAHLAVCAWYSSG